MCVLSYPQCESRNVLYNQIFANDISYCPTIHMWRGQVMWSLCNELQFWISCEILRTQLICSRIGFYWPSYIFFVLCLGRSVVRDCGFSLVSPFPSRHMTSIQRRLNVDATSWRCIDVETTLYKRHMSAGFVCLIHLVKAQPLLYNRDN